MNDERRKSIEASIKFLEGVEKENARNNKASRKEPTLTGWMISELKEMLLEENGGNE